MPVPGFLASFADKAQSALSGALPSHDPHALESIQHQLRSLGQQYSSTTPVQRIITVEKGVAIDFDSLSRDAKAQSKELYTWGQSEEADIKDVTDRLAYLNFVHGSLASSLAVKLDAARAPLKTLRDAEAALTPRRNFRAGLQLQINRIEHDQPKGLDKRMTELKEQLKKNTADDQPQETEVELLKRQAVRESEQHKWEAIREYGEKLVLLSQAATPIIAALPTFPPTPAQPYAGGQATGAARASLQRALDNYKTGHINLPPQTAGSDLSRSDTRSFGESHARELSSMSSDVSTSLQPGLPVTPPPGDEKHRSPVAKASSVATSPNPNKAHSPPLDPSTLNLSPAPIPSVVSLSHPVAAPAPINPVVLPTVAETGVPVSAGADGPGPASGSLRDIKAASSTAGPKSGGLPGNEASVPAYGIAGDSQKFESAADEKRRLQAYSEAAQQQQQPPPAAYETAEEEKKRLEREERERLLFGQASQSGSSGANKGPGPEDDLPPSYQDNY